VQPATRDLSILLPVFVVGKGEREGKGGDEARLALKRKLQGKGPAACFGYGRQHKHIQPPQTGILLP